MLSSTFSNACITIFTCLILCHQLISIVQAGNCFYHRTNDVCYDISETDAPEEQCTGSFYSDESLKELDGYVYAENCRDVTETPKRCDVDCGLGQECQWLNGQEMCICSPASCTETDSSVSQTKDQAVCASNNVTFRSPCILAAWKCNNQQSALYIKYEGICQKDCRNVRCSHDKVCLLVENTGEPMCYPKNHCDPNLNPEPVCGTNGVTYSNICIMRLTRNSRGQSPELAHKGPCERTCRPDLCQSTEMCVYSKQSRPVCIRCQYPTTFFTRSGECSMNIPVCGSDGHLYKNYCSLLVNRCEKGRYITIVDYGTCSTMKHKKIRQDKRNYSKRHTSLEMNP